MINIAAIASHLDILGKNVRDKVTGFTGVASSVSFDLYGCVQLVIQPPTDKDGKLVDGRWFDMNRIEVLEGNRVMPVPSYMPPESFSHGPAEKPAPR